MDMASELESVVVRACAAARVVPGFLTEVEARMLAVMAACTPGDGAIVEIGSFKGKSTVALATVAAHYGLEPVVSIDPHTSPSETCPDLEGQATSFDEFLQSLKKAGVEQQVEVHKAYSQEVAKSWTRPIRLLWIDGDHTYVGAQSDFDLFSPFVIEGGVIALHDTLHEFEGPIRVFLKEMLRSDKFGPAGFCESTGWAQYRPQDGGRFQAQREALAKKAERVTRQLRDGKKLHGLEYLRYKLARARVPRGPIEAEDWVAKLGKS